MSKATSYVIVGVVAFVAGGFSFQLVGRTGESTAESKSVDGRASGGEATAVVPREFVIEGMTCQGCADSITSALTQVPGVKSAKVSLVDKRAVVLAGESEVPAERILAAIATAGYKGQLASAAQSTPATAATPTKQHCQTTQSQDNHSGWLRGNHKGQIDALSLIRMTSGIVHVLPERRGAKRAIEHSSH